MPPPTTPDTLDAAMDAIHNAWTGGQISPTEAESCQRLINGRYRGWIRAQAGKTR
jgi:hypothetical protein